MAKWIIESWNGTNAYALYRLPSPGLSEPIAVFGEHWNDEAQQICAILNDKEQEESFTRSVDEAIGAKERYAP